MKTVSGLAARAAGGLPPTRHRNMQLLVSALGVLRGQPSGDPEKPPATAHDDQAPCPFLWLRLQIKHIGLRCPLFTRKRPDNVPAADICNAATDSPWISASNFHPDITSSPGRKRCHPPP